VLLPVSIVPKGHGLHTFSLQDTQGSHEEQEKGGTGGNGIVKGGFVVAGGGEVGKFVGRISVGVEMLVEASVGISVGSRYNC
jgi:hypothetical protein